MITFYLLFSPVFAHFLLTSLLFFFYLFYSNLLSFLSISIAERLSTSYSTGSNSTNFDGPMEDDMAVTPTPDMFRTASASHRPFSFLPFVSVLSKVLGCCSWELVEPFKSVLHCQQPGWPLTYFNFINRLTGDCINTNASRTFCIWAFIQILYSYRSLPRL